MYIPVLNISIGRGKNKPSAEEGLKIAQKVSVDPKSEMPATGGRSSQPIVGNFLQVLIDEANDIGADFPLEMLKVCTHLAKYNGDVSYAVDNIVQLGNTPFAVTFDDGVSQKQAIKLNKFLNVATKKIYPGGINSLINDLYAQMAITGALSAEKIPNLAITEIAQVAIVPPITIRHKYNFTTYKYEQYQVSNGFAKSVSNTLIGRVKLNPVTYTYLALRRFDDNPTAIPPFIAAFEGIVIEKDMLDNMRCIVKKLGLFGFLTVLNTAPTRKQGETDEVYWGRCQAYLTKLSPEIQKGFANGIVSGFKGSQEFKLEGSGANLQGAREMFNLISEIKMAGLKQDPLMLGRNFNVAETMARVIMAKLTTQVGNYQRIVATFMEDLFRMMLVLAGFTVNDVTVEFEQPMIGDKYRDEQAYELKIKNRLSLRDAGIIGQDHVAQELNYESAHAPKNVDYTVPIASDLAKIKTQSPTKPPKVKKTPKIADTQP